MAIEWLTKTDPQQVEEWAAFLESEDLHPNSPGDFTCLIREQGKIIASASLDGPVIQYIAVDRDRRGEDLTARLITAILQEAFRQDRTHLFIYTKPCNRALFAGLLFYEVAETDQVLLLENIRGGCQAFVAGLAAEGKDIREANSGKAWERRSREAKETEEKQSPYRSDQKTEEKQSPYRPDQDQKQREKKRTAVSSIVMNADPFTKGHLYLVQKAAAESAFLYIFVVSEDRAHFSAADRLRMVQKGTACLSNVGVLPSGPYLLSQATFPTYFLKERQPVADVKCGLDAEIFTRYFAPAFGIERRYIGTEEDDPVTRAYNDKLREILPKGGIEVRVIKRLCQGGKPISARDVRAKLGIHNRNGLEKLLPPSTLAYLTETGQL